MKNFTKRSLLTNKSILVRVLGVGAAALVTLALFSSPVAGQDGLSEALQLDLNNLWVIIAAILVFLMQAGFAFLEAGLTRAKNVANIMAKNLADMSVGVLAFFAVGYGFAFGEDSFSLIGLDSWFLSGSDVSTINEVSGLSEYTFFFFQVVFAATAVTIASGAMAERTKFSGYLLFSAAMTLFIYPIVVHAVWHGEGLLKDLNISGATFTDFAGSTVVHSTGGWAALMGAVMLGPRLGKYEGNSPQAIPGHNIAFGIIGVFILWFGWFGFNAGSELALDNVVYHAALTTLLAGAAGGAVAGFTIWLRTGFVEVAMIGNGILAGLVGITAGTAIMNPLGALVTGAVAGIIVVYSIIFFERIQIDDPVGAISVHGVCGVWGTLAVGLFAINGDVNGLFYGGGGSLLLVQAIGVGAVFVWVTVTAGTVFIILQKFNLLRVSREDEAKGLDVSEHGSMGYGRSWIFELPEHSEAAEVQPGLHRIADLFRKKKS